VTAGPAGLNLAEIEPLVLELVENLSPLKSRQEPQSIQERARLLLACHGAIRAGQELNREEIMALLAQLDEVALPSHCPHGRPLWRLISLAELHQSFRRPRG
jgi:DNA mismatch repair protein MutL